MSFKFSKKRGEWKEFEKALDPAKFDRAMKKNIRRATALNGKVFERVVRKTIERGGFAANRPLTTAIKGSSKPLVDTGHGLYQAITSQVVDDFTVFVGINQKHEFYNVGRFLHDGGVIPVTEKMRGLFYVLWLASSKAIDPAELTGRAAELWKRMSGGWFPLGRNTQAIMIPSRPFIKKAIGDADFRKRAKENWEAAMNATFKEIAGSQGRGA